MHDGIEKEKRFYLVSQQRLCAVASQRVHVEVHFHYGAIAPQAVCNQHLLRAVRWSVRSNLWGKKLGAVVASVLEQNARVQSTAAR